MRYRAIVIFTASILTALAVLGVLSLPALWSQGEGGSVVVGKDVELAFEVPDEQQLVLLYFGFVGCSTICSPSLEEMARVHESLDTAQRKVVAAVFVNLTPEVPSDAMVKTFNPAFVGIDLDIERLNRMTETFGVYRSDPLSRDGELFHTGNLYLLERQGKHWKHLRTYFTRPFDVEHIQLTIQRSLHDL